MSDSKSQEILYVEFDGYIDELTSFEMMDKLNKDPYTKIIHTTFIEAKNKRLFVLEKTETAWIKIVGRTNLMSGALEPHKFVVDQEWVIGNISTTFSFPEHPKQRTELIANNRLMNALNLSCVRLVSFTPTNITLSYNTEHNMSKFTA